MSMLYRADSVSRLGVALFTAAGASVQDALATTQALVTSSLMGHDSHGVIRIPEYLGFVANGSIVVDAPLEVEHTGPTTAVVDCGHGFGAVGAEKAIRVGIEIAPRSGRHASSPGAVIMSVGWAQWVQPAAEEGMLALATCNSPLPGHHVFPWGGRDGRLGTNPIAYAVPKTGDPVLADFATSVAPEGKIRFHRNEGKKVPDGWILDADGKATNDASAFYGPPRGGLLPLGATVGYKGFALGLLAEILGSALEGISSKDPTTFGNGVCFFVVDPSAFLPQEQFRQLVDETVAYVKSSRPAPGFEEVLIPGELEFRTLRQRQIDGIPVDPATLLAMREHGDRLGVSIDGFLNPEGEE